MTPRPDCPACNGPMHAVVCQGGTVTTICYVCEQRARFTPNERLAVRAAELEMQNAVLVAQARRAYEGQLAAEVETARLADAMKNLAHLAQTYRRERDQLQQFTNRRLKRVA